MSVPPFFRGVECDMFILSLNDIDDEEEALVLKDLLPTDLMDSKSLNHTVL